MFQSEGCSMEKILHYQGLCSHCFKHILFQYILWLKHIRSTKHYLVEKFKIYIFFVKHKKKTLSHQTGISKPTNQKSFCIYVTHLLRMQCLWFDHFLPLFDYSLPSSCFLKFCITLSLLILSIQIRSG